MLLNKSNGVKCQREDDVKVHEGVYGNACKKLLFKIMLLSIIKSFLHNNIIDVQWNMLF